MIDLYGRLGISSSATESEIRATIAASRQRNIALADRASAILLIETRRRAYDRLWHALTRIGHVRAYSSLNDAPFGLSPEYSEFRFRDREAFKSTAPNSESSRPPRNSGKSASSAAAALPTVRKQIVNGLLRSWPLILLICLFVAATFDGKNRPLQTDSTPVAGSDGSDRAKPVSSNAANTTKLSNLSDYRDPEPVDRKTQKPVSRPQPGSDVVALEVQPLPKTGEGTSATRSGSDNWIEVKTSGDHHSLIRIERLDGELVARQFIRAGDSLRIYLPIGEYVMKTATGRQWFGRNHLFGEQTSFGKPEGTFPLSKRGEYWTVELIPQRDGNLREKRISREEFGFDQ